MYLLNLIKLQLQLKSIGKSQLNFKSQKRFCPLNCIIVIPKNNQKIIKHIFQEESYQKHQSFPEMRAKLVYIDNKHALQQIYHQLKNLNIYAENPYFDSYFQKITKQMNHEEPIFAIGFEPKSTDQIKIIFTLHTEYKLTRQLCKCLHIEQVFAAKDINLNDIQDFHKNLIPQLDCYKIVALGIQENSLLKPNQKFMTIQNKPML